MDLRPGLPDKIFPGFTGLDQKEQGPKSLALFFMASLLAHGLLFLGIWFFHQVERARPQPKAIQVDLVSFMPEPEAEVKGSQPSMEKGPAPEPVTETATISLDARPVSDEPRQDESVPILKPDVSLKTKPRNLKEIMAAGEKKKEEKKPEKQLKPRVNPEKELEKARQKLARKLDDRNEQQLSDALKRLRESVESRGSGTDGGAGPSRQGYKPIDLYKMVLQSAIEQNWVFNEVLARMDQDLQVRILIKILKSGEIRDITYETRSGNRYLDESAKKAIKRASPLPELPQGMRSYDVVVIFTPKGLK